MARTGETPLFPLLMYLMFGLLFFGLLSETGPNKLTVGKIYGGMLILENWKQTRFSALPAVRKMMPVNICLKLNVVKLFFKKILLGDITPSIFFYPFSFSRSERGCEQDGGPFGRPNDGSRD